MSLRELALAIRLLHPELPSESLALSFDHAARLARVDGLALVALAEHESHFRPDAVSPDGEDFGLCQVRARFRSACRELESTDCALEKERLRSDPRYNLVVVAGSIKAAKKGKAWRKKPTMGTWLAALAGVTSSKHPKVREVEAIYQKLRRDVRKQSGSEGTSASRKRKSKKR